MTHDAPSADVAIKEIVDRLTAKFPQHSRATVHDAVTQAYSEFDNASVRDFVDVLVEKSAKKVLKHLKE